MLHLLPQCWFRNTWSWTSFRRSQARDHGDSAKKSLRARHSGLGEYFLHAELEGELLFCENETNRHRLFGTEPVEGYFKDAFHDYVVRGDHTAVNPLKRGTKAAFLHVLDCARGRPVRGSPASRRSEPRIGPFERVRRRSSTARRVRPTSSTVASSTS